MDYNQNVAKLAVENENFRREILTGPHSQVVLMSLKPGEDIGEETHKVDQILVFVQGFGEAVLNGVKSPVEAGSLVMVPAGTQHNFINTGESVMKLYTVYAPAEHAPGTVHKTRAEAMAAEELEHKQ